MDEEVIWVAFNHWGFRKRLGEWNGERYPMQTLNQKPENHSCDLTMLAPLSGISFPISSSPARQPCEKRGDVCCRLDVARAITC
jgi:hypothetical protein